MDAQPRNPAELNPDLPPWLVQIIVKAIAFASPVVLSGQVSPSSGDAAVAAAKGTDIGNVGRNCLRGPVQANVDFAVSRGIRVAEGKTLRIRVDAFNVLNRANRAGPVSDLAAAAATGGSLDPNTGRVISGGNFGRIISNSSNPRILQVSIHFDF